ncbi:MAG: hypothetical protein EON60_05050 [Alphaproteobacteria bacterium]|nr:MAG: hypothetical protein EON60_05050 [Alphaproteobacteria bacterium]
MPVGMDVRQAVALLDLSLSGVHAEMGEMLHDWLSVPKPVAPKPMGMVDVGTPAAAQPPARTPVALTVPDAAPANLPAAPARPVAREPEVAGKVWSDGEAGGVVLVVQGGMPDARCQTLAQAMLAAAGLKDMAPAWVGYSGKVDSKALMEAMRALAPQQVLVMGQGPLGVLLGKNLGVEGWHAAATKTLDGWEGPVGVTYPLDLLLKQPLFKRLAWQHLLAWGDDETVREIA